MSLVIQRSLKILRRRSFQRYGVRRVQKEKAVYFQQRNFDEGAAEVKRLLQRDRKELTALENSLATEFAASNAGQKVQSDLEPDTDGVADIEVDTSNRALSPFGEGYTPSQSRSPFDESLSGLSPQMAPDPIVSEPWWGFIKQITLGQLVIVVTFTSMISLMFGTFYVVLTSGGISFND
eukprot:TRINITY_DN5590_c1_g3_i1.p3 TRINITY_DN5590_c1_g3~~TRINITY_DN5590_c1_g3_i1.p3  ORF type:complete len:179 (-),score=19.27 TRINITY_DN5590_c1_g3_i1:57-593(-)